eukprot:SAG22_NODE_806_length_7087_cov_11.682885_3_plen_252_part_00
MDKSVRHLFAGLVQQLDKNGDGEIDIKEWTREMPKELVQEIRRKGKELTAVQTGVQAMGIAASGGGKIIQDHTRDKEQQKYFEKVKAAKSWGKRTRMGDIKEHLRAAHGQSAQATQSARAAYSAVAENGEKQPPMRWTSRDSASKPSAIATSKPHVSDREANPTMGSLEAARVAARRARARGAKEAEPENAIRRRVLARMEYRGEWVPRDNPRHMSAMKTGGFVPHPPNAEWEHLDRALGQPMSSFSPAKT